MRNSTREKPRSAPGRTESVPGFSDIAVRGGLWREAWIDRPAPAMLQE